MTDMPEVAMDVKGLCEELRPYASKARGSIRIDVSEVAKIVAALDRLAALAEERDRLRAELRASRLLVERRTAERDKEAERADGNYSAYREMIEQRDARALTGDTP